MVKFLPCKYNIIIYIKKKKLMTLFVFISVCFYLVIFNFFFGFRERFITFEKVITIMFRHTIIL